MTPEIRVFVFAGAVTAFAYTALYPLLRNKTINRLIMLDLAMTIVILSVVGAVYFGTGTAFSLVFFEAPWWVFTAISGALIETPFFLWFCKRWNIDLSPPPE